MTIFLVLLILCFWASLKGINRAQMWWLSFFLAVILGFRGKDVGDDTARYISYFNSVDVKDGTGYMEIGWSWFSDFIKSIGFSAYFFNFLVACITLSCFVYVISKTISNNKFWGSALFVLYSCGFYLYMFNGMRQFLAISIVFLAFHLAINNKNIWAAVLILFASLFHTSAICGLFIFLVKHIKLTNTTIISALVASLLIGYLLIEKVVYYFAGGYARLVSEYGFRKSVAYVIIVCGLTNVFYVWLYNLHSSKRNDGWMKVFFASVVLMNLLCNVTMGPRLVFFYSTAQIIVLSYYMITFQKNQIVRSVIYIYSFITFFRFLLPELYRTEEGLLPYYMTFSIFE